MAIFLLEDRDFKGFWMKIKVTLNQIFSKFGKFLSGNQKCDGRTNGHEDPYIPPTLVKRRYKKQDIGEHELPSN
jgi:hypothetical protein